MRLQAPIIRHTITLNDDRKQASPGTRILTSFAVALGAMALLGAIAYILPGFSAPIGPSGIPSHVSTDPANLPYYALRSVFRMFIALVFSLIFAFVYGLAAARSKRLGTVLIPLLDILQSVPILGFLSATISIWLVIFPGSILGVEAASIFAIFTSQAWNMAFSFYNSLTTEPSDLDEAVRILRLTRWQRFWKLDVPNSMIPLLWNCMMSVGGGWFFLTASEMISVNNRTLTLPGIGSYVEEAAGEQNLGRVGLAILTMIIVVVLIDFVLWKPLTAWAEKFRLTQNQSSEPRRSLVLTVLRLSGINDQLARLGRPISTALDRITRPLGRTGARWKVQSRKSRAGDLIWYILVGLACLWGIWELFDLIKTTVGYGEVGHALLLGCLTFIRVVVLMVICSLIWVPIGAIIGMNPKISRILQPVVQILASFPANFIFPFITLIFVAWKIDINWGSIFLMALGTQWYILFNVIAGASAIPDDLLEMSRSLRQTTWQRWKTLILPAVFSSWCTGGITAAGGAWNASIVSEVVTYGKTELTAKGLGAYIAQFTATGDMTRVMVGVVVMSVFVVAVDRLFWTPMQSLARRRYALN
ncbi:ABC transporter permease subunit [Bifidobacterium sp. W8108]|uniref:ABC transporter permease n=1 Tax=unclassified Bifidobacterium TaxID=2608897 RepID=UPI0018DBC79F|nr:ABC transporter permease subunit [Bifidobacterium sp. W8108]MBI0173425.1 ABC transporter permease subunit [Bifidobacterium sp. M0307]